MTDSDLITFFGYLLAAWVSGFTGGYFVTIFKRAVDAAI